MKVCAKCGVENDDENKYCAECASPLSDGSQQSRYSLTPSSSSSTPAVSDGSGTKENKGKAGKEPLIMALLSLFVPGLGQMLIGQMAKGAGLLVGTVLITFIFSCMLHGFGGVLWFPFGLFSEIDALKLTEKAYVVK